MDTSKKFIKMCEKADEIQNLWKRKPGDFYRWHCNLCFNNPNNLKNKAYIHNVFWEGEDLIDNWECDCGSSDIDVGMPIIWLPTQNQLQYLSNKNLGDLLDSFMLWEEGSGFIRQRDNFDSMGQLWLAFVMYEKYQKIWDDEKEEWIKNISTVHPRIRDVKEFK